MAEAGENLADAFQAAIRAKFGSHLGKPWVNLRAARETEAKVGEDAGKIGSDNPKECSRAAMNLQRCIIVVIGKLYFYRVADFAELDAEPALVLSLNDGLLTASEVAKLKLNADWVVLSACNTALGEKPALRRFRSGARVLLCWGALA